MANESGADFSQPQPPVEIPYQALSPDTLAAVIESFILREGTDYGAQEVPFARKAEQIQQQIEKALIAIMFDPNEQSITLVPRDKVPALLSGQNL